MSDAPAVVRNISDTALWAAHFRAEESRRPDALFRDPFAEKLEAGRGTEIARNLPEGMSHAWAWVTRTYLFDQIIQQEITNGADLIVNCAAGLDARPYRMQLPPTLRGSGSAGHSCIQGGAVGGGHADLPTGTHCR